MNTTDYGDVLLIPNGRSPPTSYPKFFEPLGTVDELEQEVPVHRHGAGVRRQGLRHRHHRQRQRASSTTRRSGQQAGITSCADDAGASSSPTCRPSRPRPASTPLYTNYKDGWPLSPGQACVGSVSCDPKANDKLANDDRAVGRRQGALPSSTRCCTTSCKDRLTEADPTTTNWEELEGRARHRQDRHDDARLVGDRRRCRTAAKQAGKDPADIGYMPFPTQVGGKFCSVVGADYQYGDQHPLQAQGGGPRLGRLVRRQVRTTPDRQAVLPTRQGRAAAGRRSRRHRGAGVQYVELSQADGEEGLTDRSTTTSEIGAEQGRLPPEARRHRARRRRSGRHGRLLRRPEQEVGRPRPRPSAADRPRRPARGPATADLPLAR